MADQDMFSGEGENTQPKQTQQSNSGDPAPSSTNPFEDKLKGIVNEKGEPKYRDVETALEALKASQEFIDQLKAENHEREERLRELEEEVGKRSSVEETVERLLGSRQKSEPGNDQNPNSGLDAEAVKQLTLATLQEQKQGEKAEKNLNTVVTQMQEWYGDQAKDVIAKKAVELETTPSDLEKLARNNPKMALQILAGAEKSKTPQSTKSSMSPPREPNDSNEPPRFEKSLVRGGINNEKLAEGWREVQKYTNKRLGVET